MAKKKTVLYIDDNHEWARVFRTQLRPKAKVTIVSTIQKAMQIFQNASHLDAIVLGGGVERDLSTFVTIVRPRFRGPIVAAHYYKVVNRRLRQAGCTHIVHPKTDSPRFTLSLLERQAAMSRES